MKCIISIIYLKKTHVPKDKIRTFLTRFYRDFYDENPEESTLP